MQHGEPVVVATFLKLPGAAFYTVPLLTRVLKRGYIYPSVIPADAEHLGEQFEKLLPVQIRMLATVAGKPTMTAQNFITSKIAHDPIFPLIAGYDPANTDEYIEQMTLLPPTNVNRLQYVQDQLPLLEFTKKTGTFNTDSNLLAAAGFHVPYQHYRDIAPYVASLTKHRRFHIPFSRGMGKTVGGVDVADITIFMIAFGSVTQRVWFTMKELNLVLTFRLHKVAGMKLDDPEPNLADLHALLFEAIDVLYYPQLTTTYLQAIYGAFTHEDEELVDAFIERTRPAPAAATGVGLQ